MTEKVVRKIQIGEAVVEVVDELITKDPTEADHMALALTLLNDEGLVTRSAAVKTCIVALAEIALTTPEVFRDVEVQTFFTHMMSKVVETIMEQELPHSTTIVGEA